MTEASRVQKLLIDQNNEIVCLRGRLEALVAAATGLWDLLDEIDTISDLAKDNNELYRKLVEKVQRRRFQFGKTDGYDVVFRTALAGEKKDEE